MKVVIKWLVWFLGSIFLLGTVGFFVQQANYYIKQNEAKAGLEELVAQLPKLKEFNTAKIVSQEFSYTAYRMTCYYGRAYVIVGSSLPELEALDVYIDKLQLSGWMSEGTQYETSRILIRGMNDRVVVESGEPGIDIRDAVDYEQLHKTYESVIFVRIDYMVPSRENC